MSIFCLLVNLSSCLSVFCVSDCIVNNKYTVKYLDHSARARYWHLSRPALEHRRW